MPSLPFQRTIKSRHVLVYGGNGAAVEADETYLGKTEVQPTTRTSGKPFTAKNRRGPSGKRAVVALVERGGSVRSFRVDRANVSTVASIVAPTSTAGLC